jgi:tripartite-type tricarboxylate transporter receptor subunit TctC
VLERQNRSADELRRDLADFQDKLSPGAVGLFYFAGHGVQAGRGLNYLLPVGVDYRRERDAELYGLEAGTVLRRMEESGAALNLVILDACRDSPLPSEGRSSGSRGLGRMEAPSGSLIAFATAPGSTADENGRGRNGLYTQHLLRAIEQPGLRLEDVFKRVRRAVETDSNRRQSPEEISKLTSEEPFYFLPARPAMAPPAAAVPTPADLPAPSAIAAPPAPDMHFPQRPITLVVPFAAGSPADGVGRHVAEALRRALGGSAQVQVESVAGGGGVQGAQKVARASADGYTLLLNHIGMATTAALYRTPPFQPLDDFETLGIVGDMPMAVVGRASLPAATMAELSRWLQTQGARATVGDAGLGSVSHLCALLLADSLGTGFTEVPFKGNAPALVDLLAGQVDVMCDQVGFLNGQLAAGRLKGYALLSKQRVGSTPSSQLPALTDLGLRGDMTVWYGLYAPRGTPQAVSARINQALRTALQDVDLRRKLEAQGAVVASGHRTTAAGHRAFAESEIKRWTPLIRAAGTTLD